MKTFSSKTMAIFFAALVAIAFWIVLSAGPKVGAAGLGDVSGRVVDLQVTNMLDATKTVALAPTNTVVWFNTGHYVDVSDSTDVGIEVRATEVSTNTTDLIVVRMVRASVGGIPDGTDFEAQLGSSAWSFAVPVVTTGTPSAAVTNTIVWHTNLPSLWLRGATHLGVGALTNSALPLTSSAVTATNSQVTGLKVSVVFGQRRGY